MSEEKNKENNVNPDGQQDRKGNYGIDGVSYSDDGVHVGGESPKDDSRGSNSKKKSNESKKNIVNHLGFFLCI